jgi:DeoR family glycerol-3-phosphate regulon repressor
MPQSHSSPPHSPRQAAILRFLQERGSAEVGNLAAELCVSTETIRRDLRQLEESREVIKRHGSAALPYQLAEAPFERRMRETVQGKRAIARRAARLVDDGDSLMVDAGSTTSIFAQELLKKRNLTVVTNSSDIARTLATVNGNKVYMAGGELNGDNGAAFGPSAIAFVAGFRVRHAFISIAGLEADFGASDAHLAEAEFARMVLSRAEQRAILSDATKFGRTSLIKVCDFDAIDRLVCDAMPDGKLAQALAAAKVRVNVVAP